MGDVDNENREKRKCKSHRLLPSSAFLIISTAITHPIKARNCTKYCVIFKLRSYQYFEIKQCRFHALHPWQTLRLLLYLHLSTSSQQGNPVHSSLHAQTTTARSLSSLFKLLSVASEAKRPRSLKQISTQQ